LAAVRVQVAQLRRRLGAFATWQADWAQQGWRIERVEAAPEEGRAALIVDGRPMVLHGRIDRIDRNEHDGRRIVFDYKTSDSASSPEKKHQKGDEWIDLQLPLYRLLLPEEHASALSVEIGYFNLPKATSDTGIQMWDSFSQDLLSSSEKCAGGVIESIRNRQFWPPAPKVSFDDFAHLFPADIADCIELPSFADFTKGE